MKILYESIETFFINERVEFSFSVRVHTEDYIETFFINGGRLEVFIIDICELNIPALILTTGDPDFVFVNLPELGCRFYTNTIRESEHPLLIDYPERGDRGKLEGLIWENFGVLPYPTVLTPFNPLPYSGTKI